MQVFTAVFAAIDVWKKKLHQERTGEDFQKNSEVKDFYFRETISLHI